jgi:hypothetical protein
MYYKDQQFQVWLASNGDAQARQSRGYIDSLIKNVLCIYGLDTIFVKMSQAIQQRDNTLAKFEDLHSKINKAAALKINYPNSSIYSSVNNSMYSIQQWCSVLKKYIDFLKQIEPNNNNYKNWGAQQWNNAMADFWKNTVDAVAIDGYTSLLNAPSMKGNMDDFVKLALENSYFLNKTATIDIHNDLINKIKYNIPVYARKSNAVQKAINGIRYFVGVAPQIPILADPDGNKEVRILIEKNTGYTVSSGYNDFFTNFKISHIWGNANDPRFFTSFWNIVIVPAWANDNLDKNNSGMPLAGKMINTYKAVCEELYGAASLGQKLGINPKPSFDPNYVVKGPYTVNVLNNTTNGTIGTIKKVSVTV